MSDISKYVYSYIYIINLIYKNIQIVLMQIYINYVLYYI